MRSSILELQSALGYTFKNQSLLMQALTHPSYLGEHKADGNNQRMEYLGDAVLELAVSTFLYQRCTDKSEGELSRIRAAIVSEKPLHAVAEILSLGKFIQMSLGEQSSGGSHKCSILSDALEAVFGAVYLDGGFEAAEQVVLRLLNERMEAIVLDHRAAVDYKSRLQEELQKDGNINIQYVQTSAWGPPHDMCYEFAVELEGKELGRGEGKTKKAAQQSAAGRALEHIGALGN